MTHAWSISGGIGQTGDSDHYFTAFLNETAALAAMGSADEGGRCWLDLTDPAAWDIPACEVEILQEDGIPRVRRKARPAPPEPEGLLEFFTRPA